jgi:hypothetical protein
LLKAGGIYDEKLDQAEETAERKDRFRLLQSVDPAARMKAFVALVVTGGFFGSLYRLMFLDVPTKRDQTLDVMVGELRTCWVAIINDYFRFGPGPKKEETAARKRRKNYRLKGGSR